MDTEPSPSSLHQPNQPSAEVPKAKDQSWQSILISGMTVVGVAAAAAYASVHADEKAVGITAWVAVAVVGASTMIATMKRHSR